jgi:carboxymethylenebutenolidase
MLPPNESPALSRREFTALSLAATLAGATGASAAGVTEKPVNVSTPSGTCDAVLVQPDGKGPWPAVILFPDAFALRPSMRDIAKRLSADGYVVLAVNQYYRSMKAPPQGYLFDFTNPAEREKFMKLRAPLTNDAVADDAKAFVAFLDSQPVVNKQAKVGLFGYCMGGLMSVQAARGLGDRVGAVASFHGGGLVTDQPDSPHRFIPQLHGEYLIAIAENDHDAQPDAKQKLIDAFKAGNVPATVEVFPGTIHGWCVKDMPTRDGKQVYNEAQAEKAWEQFTALVRRRVV